MPFSRQHPGTLGRRRFLVLSAAAVASAALAACSSSSPTATPTAPAPTATTAPTASAASAISPTRPASSALTNPTTAPTTVPTAAAASASAPTTGTATAGTPAATSAVAMNIAPDATPQFRAVAEKVQALLAAGKVPGAALGILSGGREEYATFGAANAGTKETVTNDTLLQIGSLTKTYTTTAVMRLMEQGKIDLNATVRTYLPDFRLMDEGAAAQVTIKNLLTHTGGWWGDAFIETGSGEDAIARYMAEKLPTFPQVAPVGQYFSYNNSGFIVAGRVIEVVTGMPYRQAIQRLVLDPLGLSPTAFNDDALKRPHALGYGVEQGTVKEVTPLTLPRNVDPAGGLWSTARAQLRYARFHMGDGTANGAPILTPETLKLMQTPQPYDLHATNNIKIGLNWLVQDFQNIRLIAHPGDTFGQHAEFVAVPEKGFAFVFLANGEPGGALVASQALNESLKIYLGLGGAPSATATAGVTPTPASLPPTVALPAAKLAEYAGRYTLPSGTAVLRVENGAVQISVEKGTRTDLVTPNVRSMESLPENAHLSFFKEDLALLVADDPTQSIPVIFVRKPDGSIGWLSASLRLIPKVS
jgi:CubicO group peptidase (beta-lactamase class C family)